VDSHHVDDFIVDITTATSAANAAHHYRNLRVYFGARIVGQNRAGPRPVWHSR
jgi:hypothetical protein